MGIKIPISEIEYLSPPFIFVSSSGTSIIKPEDLGYMWKKQRKKKPKE